MTLYEHMVLQLREGLAENHRERDRALTFMARYGGSQDLDAWLEELALERAQHGLMVDGIVRLAGKNDPVLRMQVRATRMAKASLRPAALERTGTHR